VAGERVTNLRVLKGYLYADVRLGLTETGHEVLATVRLNTNQERVLEALEPLNDVIRDEARSMVLMAVNEHEIREVRDRADRAVREATPAAVEARVEKHSVLIERALRVLASVGPQQETDDYNTRNVRRHALRDLREALRSANL
jgi:hypothetical protein